MVQIKAAPNLGLREHLNHGWIGEQVIKESTLPVEGLHGALLHEFIGLLTRPPLLNHCQHHSLTKEEPATLVEVVLHRLGIDD